ncbi:hypothetical protein [Ekhidna sp.]
MKYISKIKEAEITLSKMDILIANAAVLAYYTLVTFALHTLIQSI